MSYRASMREVALSQNVSGWVRNTEEGGVEAVVQGAEGDVERLLEWAKNGPPGARVSSVRTQRVEGYPEQDGFRIVVPDWWVDEEGGG